MCKKPGVIGSINRTKQGGVEVIEQGGCSVIENPGSAGGNSGITDEKPGF